MARWNGEGGEACGVTHTLGSGACSPPDIQREGVARLFVVRVCVMTFCGNTSAVETCQTNIDTQRVVLRQVKKVRVAQDVTMSIAPGHQSTGCILHGGPTETE
jgi:hypothetical protein